MLWRSLLRRARWAGNPYWQHFCGETFFQQRLPIDPSSLTRWRKRIGGEGEEDVDRMLPQTIEAGKRAGAVKDTDLTRVTVDTTMMERNIAHPTDARLYGTARRKLAGRAREAPIGPDRPAADLHPPWHPGWPGRSGAMPMPGNASGCTRHCAGSRATPVACCGALDGPPTGFGTKL